MISTFIPFFFMNDSSPVMFATAWRICEGGICKRRQMICIDIEKGPLRYINVPGDQGKMPISCRPSREWQPPRLVPSAAARRQRNPATSTACSAACLQSACSCRCSCQPLPPHYVLWSCACAQRPPKVVEIIIIIHRGTVEKATS